MECAKSRGSNDVPRAHFTNCAERVRNPSTMLKIVGFGMFPAAMWTSNVRPSSQAAGVRDAIGRETIQTLDVSEILRDERVEILTRELLEERNRARGRASFR